MKKIEMMYYLIISFFLVAFVLVIGSCTKEGETVIIPKTIDEYKQQMSQFVSSEKAIVGTCVIGYNKGDFKVASTSSFVSFTTNYLTVLNDAEMVLSKTDVTIAEIVAANKTLGVSGKLFLNSLFISDRRPLVDPIVAAEALNTATIVGTAVGQVSQAAKTTFTAAITAAKSTRDASTTIDRLVEEAVKKLDEAKKAFESAIIK